MKARKKLNIKRKRRAARTGARIRGTAARPRLVVNRSNRYLYAQLIDDGKGITLAAVMSRVNSSEAGKAGAPAGASVANATNGASDGKKLSKSDQAFAAGEALAKKALAKDIASAVFDRRSAKFHGRIKRFADGAKKGGLKI